MPPRLVLIGPPGAGKSTVAAVLAHRLGVPTRDSGSDVEAAAGMSVSDIFIDQGEKRFRELEREAAVAALASDGIVELGGGAVMDDATQAALDGHTVVLLQVGIADAAKRVGFDRSRPMLAVNPRAQWVRLLQSRRDTYERLATFAVDTAGRSPEDVATEIIARLPGPEGEQ